MLDFHHRCYPVTPVNRVKRLNERNAPAPAPEG